MRRRRKISGSVIDAVIFLFLEIAALSVLKNSATVQDIGLSRFSHGFKAAVWGTSQRISGYFSLKKTNEKLAADNFELQRQLRDINLSVRELRGGKIAEMIPRQDNFSYIPAEIVKMGTVGKHNYIIIDKGSDDGIRPRSGIITSKGVIGIIQAVSRHYSFGISLMNYDFKLSARLGLEGVVGPVSWDGISTGKARFSEIPIQTGFNPGDTVYTSGYSEVFPADIPIGTAGSSRIVDGSTCEISLDLLENFRALRYVTVTINDSREEFEEIERQIIQKEESVK